MASVSLLVVLAPGLLLGVVCLFRLGISRSGKKRPSLQRYEHTHAFAYDSSQAKPQVETSVTLGPVATTSGSCMPSPATSAEAILQFVLDALHHLTGLPLLMVNQPDHNLPSSIQTQMTQMRADQKNAELSSTTNKGFSERSASATWSEHEAPEEEISDLCSDEEEQNLVKEGVASNSTAQNQLFDGLEFYLAVSQVRERTVRSVLALGMAKTLTTLRDRQQNESIAVIEQKYPDFTCLPTSTKSTVQEFRGSEQRPLDLLAALRLPSAAAVARSQSPMKGPVRARLATDEEGRVRRPPLPSHGPNISRVA